MRYDESKLVSGHNYPVCARLDALYQALLLEEASPADSESHWRQLYAKGELHCGRRRAYGPLWIFGKKHFEPIDVDSCAGAVLPAKRRMLAWLGDLCATQDKGNSLYKQQLQQQLAGASEGSSGASQLLPAPVPMPASQRQRGLVYTGLPGEHFRSIYQSILAHRNLRVALPVEVWVAAEDLAACKGVFEASDAFQFPLPGHAEVGRDTEPVQGSTTCHPMAAQATGFAAKFHALLGTALTDVLFMDADNIAVRDVNQIFDSAQYRDTGAVLWPDLWGNSCRSSALRSDKGYAAFSTNVLWQAQVGGLQWQPTRQCAQEAEAGQIAFDLTRHGALLEVGLLLMEGGGLLKNAVNGDKDVFRLLHLMVGEPFSFVDTLPGYSTTNPGAGRDCLTQYFGTEGEAGEHNWISKDNSGAFELEHYKKASKGMTLASSAAPLETTGEPKKLEKDFYFSFGAFIGSIFGSPSAKVAKVDCDGAGADANCDGGSKEKAGFALHGGALVPTKDIEDPAVRATYIASGGKAINAAGRPAGTGWGAPIGVDPMFFHQLKMRDPRAFRFAYRFKGGQGSGLSGKLPEEGQASVCYDWANHENKQRTEKNPSADRLFLFAQKLFAQTDWKWERDPTNSWARDVRYAWWRRAVRDRYGTAIELLTLPALFFGVAVVLLLRKSAAGPKSA